MNKRLKILIIFTLTLIALSASISVCHSQNEKAASKPSSTQSEDQVLPPDIQTRENYLPEESSTRLGAGYWFNLFIALVIIVVMIVILGYLFRWLFARMPSFAGREDFKVLSSLRMSPQAMLYVVRFADEVYLLAATPQHVSVVSRIDDPDSVQDIVESMSNTAGATNPHAFSSVLGKKFEKAIEQDANLEKERMKRDQDRFEETAKRLEGYEKPNDEEKKKR